MKPGSQVVTSKFNNTFEGKTFPTGSCTNPATVTSKHHTRAKRHPSQKEKILMLRYSHCLHLACPYI